jgi:DNA gyrase/topoisomerase IV subunit B
MTDSVFTIRYENGHVKLVDIIDKSEMISQLTSIYDNFSIDDWSTIVVFTPNLKIYESAKSSVNKLPLKLVRLENPNSYIELNGTEVESFDFDTDIYHKDNQFLGKSFSVSVDIPELTSSVRISFTYDKDAKFDYQQTSMINLIETPSGGYHEDLSWRAIGNALKSFNPLLKQSDAKYGLRIFVSMFTSFKMFFNSQTKEKLAKLSFKDDHRQKAIDKELFISKITPKLLELLNDPENHNYFTSVVNRIIEYKRSMDRLNKKDFVMSHVEYSGKNPTASLGLSAKVFDCTSSKIEERELYVVEGRSAGGSIIQARDPKTLAVLPLRGVPLNAATSNLETVIQNPEFKSLINVLGSGVHPFTKMDKRRYDKIILGMDADAGGSFISALVLGFFAKFLPEWIEEGKVFLLDPPLYKQNGKFIYNKDDLDFKKDFTRFKGLGEMSPHEVKDALIDNRRLIKVTPEGLEDALKLIINEDNQRKTLARELGILVDEDEMTSLVLRSEVGIENQFESIDVESETEDE